MFKGVDHVGVGVADMGAALDFFGRRLGFSEVLFDHTCDLPGLEDLTHRRRTRARVAMLESRYATPLGPGRVKLVQILDDGGTPAAPAGLGWGEVGICEVCVHARDVPQVHKELVETHGCTELMEPVSASVTPFDVSVDLSYVESPGGGKIEIIEWTGLWKALPGEPRLEGVNHVAFGVEDMAATRRVLRPLRLQPPRVRDERLLRADAAVVLRPPSSYAHDPGAAGAGRRDRAGAAPPGNPRRERHLGPRRPDGVRYRRLEHRSSLHRVALRRHHFLLGTANHRRRYRGVALRLLSGPRRACRLNSGERVIKLPSYLAIKRRREMKRPDQRGPDLKGPDHKGPDDNA